MRVPRLASLALLAVLLPAATVHAAPPAAAPPAVPPPAAAPPGSPAATASPVPLDEVHREATSLYEVTGGAALAGKVLDMVRGQFSAILAQDGRTAGDGARIFDEVLMPEFKARLPELRPAMIEIWADNFTVDELRGLHAFYETPLGRKILEKQPALAQQSVAVGAAWGKSVAQDALSRHADELRKRGVRL